MPEYKVNTDELREIAKELNIKREELSGINGRIKNVVDGARDQVSPRVQRNLDQIEPIMGTITNTIADMESGANTINKSAEDIDKANQ